jgi:voltage-dependent calcium channel L type alpha-1S
VTNTFILASETYDDGSWFVTFNEITNYIFTLIFFMEMALKMFGLGIKEYFKEGFNVFDSVVVMFSIIDVF